MTLIDPIEDLVGDLFVDRDEEMKLFEDWIDKMPRVHLNSYALIGRRRTGKTAILVKFFNKLFHEQNRVLPVFISFARYMDRKEPISYFEFADEYFCGYIRCYLAFRYREPLIIVQENKIDLLKSFAEKVNDEFASGLIRRYEVQRYDDSITAAHSLAQWVINFPKGEARIRNMPTAFIVDEFQVLTNVYDPRQNIHHCLTDSFQGAMETKWAPMIVSGSAVTLLAEEALSGMLSGRYRAQYLKPLSREYAHDFVFRIAEANGTKVNEELAETVWQLTAGYPHAIFVLMNSPHPSREQYPDLTALETVMTYELTDNRGALMQHYDREFLRYAEVLNSTQTTKKVMFWACKYPEVRIDQSQVAEDIGVSEEQVKNALKKLHQADIVDRYGWSMYHGPDDPMLRRYIEYNYRQEIEALSPVEAMKDWKKEYQKLQGKTNNFVGEVAEVYVEAVMRAFSGQVADGMTYFNTPGNVLLPKFSKIERRGGIVKSGRMVEIDLTGEWTEADQTHAWLVQVKYHNNPIGVADIQKFITQTQSVIETKGYPKVVLWHFCKQGYTQEAQQYMRENGIGYSNLAQFNTLAKLVGFFGLPE